ncbi:hypothetical protein [Zooshikella harenae]|uniref:Uncharacterized protein n=1 Tax=Zooshikella harenae TaxID=2827238 RepID=A0ABS5ZAB6_9GAMM|nr:hypothetical protein [Zooshikella harenae]MBU2710920.1 hypothetical protein [Zooshikella harenae]
MNTLHMVEKLDLVKVSTTTVAVQDTTDNVGGRYHTLLCFSYKAKFTKKLVKLRALVQQHGLNDMD